MIPAPASYRAAIHPQYMYSSLPQPAPAHANGPSPLPAHQGSIVDVKSSHNGSTVSTPLEYTSLPHNMSTVTSIASGAHSYNTTLGKYFHALTKCNSHNQPDVIGVFQRICIWDMIKHSLSYRSSLSRNYNINNVFLFHFGSDHIPIYIYIYIIYTIWKCIYVCVCVDKCVNKCSSCVRVYIRSLTILFPALTVLIYVLCYVGVDIIRHHLCEIRSG